MCPVLFKIGAFELQSYDLALAISVALGIWIAMKRAPRFGIKKDTILDFAMVITVASIVGSRLWYVVYHIDEFRGHWLNTINPFQNGTIGIAGLYMIGGVVLAIVLALIYAKIKKLNFLNLSDTFAPVFLLGEGIVRLGGCFGRPTDNFLAWCFRLRVRQVQFSLVHIFGLCNCLHRHWVLSDLPWFSGWGESPNFLVSLSGWSSATMISIAIREPISLL